MTSATRLLGAVVLLLASACGSGLREMTASTSDYADYREFRVAPTVAGRLRAAAFYLSCHSDGAFHDEVAEWFDRVEPLFFEASADSIVGMRVYLEALPNGPHADSAAQRRDAMLAAERVESGERLSEAGAAIERRLAAAAQTREDVITLYAAWLGRLLDFDGWGRSLDKAGAEFAEEWAKDPKAKCTPKRCSKLFTRRYELEIGGKQESFVCVLEVSLRLAERRVIEASISGPDLFSRLAEANVAEPVLDSEQARTRALAQTAQLTAGAIERKLPRTRCGHEPDEPAVMLRECDGYRLELIPKTRADEEDRVVLRGRPGL